MVQALNCLHHFCMGRFLLPLILLYAGREKEFAPSRTKYTHLWSKLKEWGIQMQKLWKLKEADGEKAAELAKELGVSGFLAGLLVRRGIDEPAAAEIFLSPEKQAFYDPFAMKDMDKAVERIARAIAQRETIVVYGDYDVDGMTATSLLIRNLRRLGAEAEYYIPDRQSEGYGFHAEALRRLQEAGTQLLISVDCGISAVAETASVGDGMDIIITDHHLPGEQLPEAVAVVDPHREDCGYPDKNLAGVGVAFKLCQALWQRLRQQDFNEDLEFVALGTIADIVPLLGENRRIAAQGLQAMMTTEFAGIRALVEVAGQQGKKLTAGHVGFMLAPRLNAAGRIATAQKGVQLLLAEDPKVAEELALELNAENQERQQLEKDILALVEKQLESVDMDKAHALVVAGEGWHPGVIGIVASRIVEKYYRPVVIISIKDGIGKGSCRSIAGFHMRDALQACSDFLLGFGGHEQAAGLSLEADKIADFRQALDDYAAAQLRPEDYVPVLDVECELPMTAVSEELIAELSRLEPFGMGNPSPLFVGRNIRGSYAQRKGRDGQHLGFHIDAADRSLTAIGWNIGELAGLVNREPVDFIFVPEINEFRGNRTLQCKVKELRPAENPESLLNREFLKNLYIFLRGIQRRADKVPYTPVQLGDLFRRAGQQASDEAITRGLEVFVELSLLQALPDKGYALLPAQGKMNLAESLVYKNYGPKEQLQ